ncbi:hypothetical protein K1T71_014801 [Dendrolimus kikuchii]|nr:hypothetical protein K1T71_014801 [Dendrolimus kikuchii]
MGLADTCRVCLTGQKRLHAISNTLFQEIWEKLTNAKVTIMPLDAAGVAKTVVVTDIGFSPVSKKFYACLSMNHDSSQEDNLDNADVESDKPSEDNTLLKQILEREVRIVLERIDTGTLSPRSISSSQATTETFRSDLITPEEEIFQSAPICPKKRLRLISISDESEIFPVHSRKKIFFTVSEDEDSIF